MNKKNLLEKLDIPLSKFNDYYENTRQEFQRIVDANVIEESLQKYLEENPLLLLNAGLGSAFPFARKRCALFSKLKFAERYVIDFSFVHADSSGANWIFIELERSDMKLFNKKGDMSKHLNHAYRQIMDWQAWIKDNRAYAQDILGKLQTSCGITKETVFSIDPNFVIIIGRRQVLNDDTIRRRNEFCNNNSRLKIITYDRLLDPIII